MPLINMIRQPIESTLIVSARQIFDDEEIVKFAKEELDNDTMMHLMENHPNQIESMFEEFQKTNKS